MNIKKGKFTKPRGSAAQERARLEADFKRMTQSAGGRPDREPAGAQEPEARRKKRLKITAISVAAVLAVVVLGLSFFLWSYSRDDGLIFDNVYALNLNLSGTADYIPSKDSRILELEYSIMIFVGEAQNVTAEISESLAYASAAELKAHIGNKQNPHGVTAEQVGLGNVPNVGTDDQTPNYTIAQSLAALTPKEKLSVAMGKIARAVQSLIDHLKNSTAHITASERSKWNNKAASVHNHSATDINSGTLGVARGGTGKASWSINQLLYPTTATNIGQIAPPAQDGMYLCQNQTGAPFWKKIVHPTIPPTSETGTYVGGGKTGSNAKNSITFQAEPPKIIYIKQRGTGAWGLLLLTAAGGDGFSVVNNVTNNLVVAASGNTVSWYYRSSESHPANQLDTSMQTYYYVGVF